VAAENPAPEPTVTEGEAAAPGSESSHFAVPGWAGDVGRWSGVIVLVALVIVLLFVLVAATKVLVMAALFAVLFGGTFLPIVDWLAKHHIKRGLAAMIVAVFLVLLGIGIGFIIVYSVFMQVPTIETKLDSAWAELQKALSTTSMSKDSIDSLKSSVQSLAKSAASGLAGTILNMAGGVASLIFGVFISLNILVWVLIQGRQLGRWASKRMGPVPAPVAYDILSNSARFFRGYIYGSTIVGLFNGGVMAVGALVIGVPLAATIGIVGWFTNYIPFFGAIISGAFAVLIALGAGGPSKAIPMLVIVIISNGYLQTVVSQFALGSALKLHPLAVLFATTTGSALFGAVGGVFAAPFLKIVVDARLKLKAAGLFSPATAAESTGSMPEGPAGAGPPGDADQGPPGGPPGSLTAQT
jgi:predicted PurR-regulated permease PerM